MYQPSGIYILEGRNSGRQINGRSRKLIVTEGVGLEVIMEMLTEAGQCRRDAGKALPYVGEGWQL